MQERNPDRDFIASCLVFIVIVTLSMSLATQMAAAFFQYQAWLGEPIFRIRDFAFYCPFAFRHIEEAVYAHVGDAGRVFEAPKFMLGAGILIALIAFWRLAPREAWDEILAWGRSCAAWACSPPEQFVAFIYAVRAPLACGAGVFLGGMFVATQCMAWIYDFQHALGAPLFQLGALAIYWPLDFFKWRGLVGARDHDIWAWPSIFVFAVAFASGIAAVLVFRQQLASGALRRGKELSSWARNAAMRAAGLRSDGPGMVLGRKRSLLLPSFITYRGDGHVLALGHTRSGKGRGIIVPTCLNWPGALVVLDPKGELADGDIRLGFPGCAGYRERLGPVLRFAPTKVLSAQFNPLLEVRRGVNEVRDVQNIVDILTTPQSDAPEQPFWRNSASNLLVGLILHVLYAMPDERKTLAEVRRLLATMEITAEAMRDCPHRLDIDGEPETHPRVEEAANSYLSMEERTQSNVRATAESYLTLFADPLVEANTSKSTFRLSDLVCLDEPVSLFLQPPPSDLERLMPLMRLLIMFLMRTLTESPSHDGMGREKRHRLLFLLDEFSALGRLPGFEKMLGLMAGYGMQAMLVCQSLNAIRGLYGRDNVILDNCEVVTTFTVNDPTTAEALARMAGERWEMITQPTRHDTSFLSLRRSVTLKEERRPLLMASDFLRLPRRDMVIFASDCLPIRAHKVRYDEEPRLRALLTPSANSSPFLTVEHDWRGIRAATPDNLITQPSVKRALPKALPAPPRTQNNRSKGI